MDTNQASAQEQANDIFYYSKMSQLGIEEWVSIPGYEQAYEVSNMGRVRSLDRKIYVTGRFPYYRNQKGKLLTQQLSIHGCNQVSVSGHSKKCWKVHVLMAFAFFGVRPKGLETCHNNGNSLDNRLFNLRYDTHVNNIKDKEKHGTKQEGQKHYRSKLTNEEAAFIVKLLSDGQLTHAEIAELVPSSTVNIVNNISCGVSWRSLAA